MRIVHLSFASTARGDTNHQQDLVMRCAADLVRAQARLGESVELYGPQQRAGLFGMVGLAVMGLPLRLRRHGTEIVHIHGDAGTATIAGWTCRRKGVPYVLTVIDQDDYEAKIQAGGLWRRKRLIAGAARLFVLDPLAVEAVREASGNTVPVVLFPLSIEPVDAPSLADLRAASPFVANATPKLLLTGLHSDEAASEWFDEVARALLVPLIREHPRLQAVALCTLDLSQEHLEQRLRDMGLGGYVRLLRLATEEEAELRREAAAYSDADAVMVYAPALSLRTRLEVLHAWAAGKPVVALPSESLSAMIDDGRTGRLVRLHDSEALLEATREVLDHNGLARLLVKQGRDHIKQFYAPERAASEVLAHYQSVLGATA